MTTPRVGSMQTRLGLKPPGKHFYPKPRARNQTKVAGAVTSLYRVVEIPLPTYYLTDGFGNILTDDLGNRLTYQ